MTKAKLKRMKNISPFINREQELAFLEEWIAEEPQNILFLFGPKSSGKTTLLMEFINRNLPDTRYDLKHFNLREFLIGNYQDFIRSIFRIDDETEVREVKKKQEYNLKFFRFSREILEKIRTKELEPFDVMKNEFKKAKAEGKRPVVIIDELQALEGIYFNGQRELLKELFNFFVAMTKESHLCHVIIASSDGYFIERIYNDSKLKKTSRFLEVDYLEEEDVKYWLDHLPEKSNITEFTLTEEQKKRIWQTFGGSCWEITVFFGDLLRKSMKGSFSEQDFDDAIEDKLLTAEAMYKDYARLYPDRRELFRLIGEHSMKGKNRVFDDLFTPLLENGLYTRESLEERLSDLVRQNFLSYNPTRATYKIQGRTLELGLRCYVNNLPDFAKSK